MFVILSLLKAEGGFLDKLFEHIRSWDVDVWEPAAEEGFTALLVSVGHFFISTFIYSVQSFV